MRIFQYLFWIILAGACMACLVSAFGQEAKPVPSPTPGTAEEWWNWCQAHPKVIFRVSKKYLLPGNAERPYEERLKVLGPPSLTPFGSMRRWRTYNSFVNVGGNIVLLNQGWNYQTMTTTEIREGAWDKVPWEKVPRE